MTAARLRLRETPWRLAICRFPADSPLPVWALHSDPTFWSMTRTPDELSLVCPEDDLPPSVDHDVERGWRAFQVEGPIPFATTGVVAGLTTPLAASGVPVFVVSTYDTDVLLVRGADLARAREVLAAHFTLTDRPPNP